jgi:5-hydroxyisourate hydrolase
MIWLMGQLTTHVLDTARGKPGAGISVKLFSLENGRHLVASSLTNDDGRTEQALLEGDTYRAGSYELEFAIGPYFADAGLADNPPFLDDVVIRFSLANDQHYHVPLLVSPWSYSTYRGS